MNKRWHALLCKELGGFLQAVTFKLYLEGDVGASQAGRMRKQGVKVQSTALGSSKVWRLRTETLDTVLACLFPDHMT
jgi:hypothetical protein